MWNKKVGSVLIVDDRGRLSGIITERDILYEVTRNMLCKNAAYSMPNSAGPPSIVDHRSESHHLLTCRTYAQYSYVAVDVSELSHRVDRAQSPYGGGDMNTNRIVAD